MAECCQELKNRIAVVTGGGSGIGRAICLILAKDGAKIVVCDINLDAAEETVNLIKGPQKPIAKHVDVSCSASVNNFFTDIEKNVGTPNILVNCAGIAMHNTLIEMLETAFDRVMAVNLKGTFLMMQAAAKAMIKDKISNGSVINFSSISSLQGFHSNYSPSKAGVDALTKNAARELGPYGIRCNAIRPGIFKTPINHDLSEEMFEAFRKDTPLRRIGKPEEVAQVVRFLASDRSSFITGDIIQVSGGWYM